MGTGLRTVRLTACLAFDQYMRQRFLFVLVEVISDEHSLTGSSHPKEIEGLSLSPRDSSGYRWCSPRCDVSRHPQCCYNPVRRRKRARGRGCDWHLYAEAPPRPGILQ